MANQSRILELDGLRTIAITAVILLHFSPHSRVFELGWVGVDLFFVISGFLITGILLNMRSDPEAYRKFYWRRTIRIFPTYYAVLAIIAFLAFAHHETFDPRQWRRVLFFIPALRMGVSWHLIVQRLMGHATFDLSRQTFVPANFSQYSYAMGVYWSLAVEELFYLLWAPVVLRGSRKLILGAAVASLVICPTIRGLTHTADWWEGIGFITRFDSLAVGACLSLLLRAKPNISRFAFLAPVAPLGLVFYWLAVRCGLFAGTEIRSTELFSICGYTLLALIFACIVAFCVQSRGSIALAPLRFGPVLYIGTISYTMYLVHFLLYVGVARVVSGYLMRGAVASLLTVAVAAVSWKYCESPILQLRNWRPATKARESQYALLSSASDE